MPTIFTIGHSNHPIERFIELLARHGVEELADIRRFPGSRAHPHFNRERLQETLESHGIAYVWIEALGGRRKHATGPTSRNLAWRNASFRNYADYLASEEFRRGLETLTKAASQRTTAMMCAEGLWWQCHRRLVSDVLMTRGATVEHIMPDGKLKPHVLTPSAVVKEGQVTYPAPNGLFDEE
jgi:uncharacterized protein (DUF488 family)